MPWPQWVAAAALLCAATPPAWFAGAEFLVVAGLGVWFGVATKAARPLWSSYWIGAVHMGVLSWSLRHVAWAGWALVALLGGLYYALVALSVRRAAGAGRVARPMLAFGLAVAGACWLRAEMPGIAYPHGQFAHALWQWPALLAPVRLGGEPLLNALLAMLGAGLCLAVRGWRQAAPPLRRARAWTIAAALAFGLCCVAMGGPDSPASEQPAVVTVAAVEPGLHPFDAFADIAPGDGRGYQRRWQQQFEERLLRPTRALFEPGADGPRPDLVLWPESSVPFSARVVGEGPARFVELAGVVQLGAGARLLLGADVERAPGRHTPAALLLDEGGRLLGHHEKQRLVPAGETLPLGWLPEAWAQAIRSFAATSVGIPDLEPGRALPSLRLGPGVGEADGAAFAGLICYDNAFPGPVAEAVDAGARLIAVLSNEAWYRGGGELAQLAAITALRAVAVQAPIVRCTMDGCTIAFDAAGQVLGSLPAAPAPQPAARTLVVATPLGSGRLPPVAQLHPWLGWGSAVGTLLLAVAACGRSRRQNGPDADRVVLDR